MVAASKSNAAEGDQGRVDVLKARLAAKAASPRRVRGIARKSKRIPRQIKTFVLYDINQ